MKKFFLGAFISLGMLTLAACQCETATPSDTDFSAYTCNLPFEMPTLSRPDIPATERCITEFGGVGDGVTLNTEAFRKAMKELSAQGGGHLIVPQGVWFTGPITFENNIDLQLRDGAVILFTGDYNAYPIVDCYFEGLKTRRCMSPLNADGKQNIAITGFGTIDGNGGAWRWVKRSKLTSAQWKEHLSRGGCTDEKETIWFPTEAVRDAYSRADMNVVRGVETEEDWLAIRDYLRPVLLDFSRCTNVLLEGVCFQNSPAWNLHPFLCENVIINNVMVINPWYSQNGDGLDLESCKNALIVNSKFDVGDDAICVKSGKDQDGRDLLTPCENVVVDRCAVYHGHGGFVVGSEMSSGVKNVSVSNCMFLGTDVGLRFKSKRGRGGVVGNIHIRNINMIDIPTDCILFDLHYSGMSASEEKALGLKKDSGLDNIPAVDETTPQFKDIYISDVVCQGCDRAMYFNGIPEMPITNINISNARIKANSGLSINHSLDITINDLQLSLPEGEQPIVTYNVRNLTVNGKAVEGNE
ncbi:MAG: glycoside hydrolase family 28 protein [Bacteroidales bacterium]|nr:glycoside hydrolase family 28 protein [Bacteroidales bacterium]